MGAKRKSPMARGVKLLHDPLRNKGTAFTEAERDVLGLRGLLPPRVTSIATQARRILENFQHKPNDLERYIFLVGLQDRNETLFYRVLVDNITQMMPIVYTPTVGAACLRFGHIWRRPRGLYISINDRGRVREVLEHWPHERVAIIVVTDGERILGLGDLGAYGMGIPIGKLSLYTACAGVPPDQCLPVLLDVGTDNQELLDDPLYTGTLQTRVRGTAYDELVDEFVAEAQRAFPQVLIQFEDFATQHAFDLLHRYRDRFCCFNDDIQGTAAVTLAGLITASRMTEVDLGDQRVVFYGAGAAATGIGDLIVTNMVQEGMAYEEAMNRVWFVDSKGLVVTSREDLPPHKQRYAKDHAFDTDLEAIVRSLQPTALIGVSGQPQTFTEPVVRAMVEWNERPIIFSLSNPTSKSECTAEQAYTWTEGRAIFASGSPFDPVTVGNRTFVPGQSNNAYVFPGIGLGVMAVRARHVTDEMFSAAARALADHATEECIREGCLFPHFMGIRDVSARIATAVAEVAYEQGLARRKRPKDLAAYIKDLMFEPSY